MAFFQGGGVSVNRVEVEGVGLTCVAVPAKHTKKRPDNEAIGSTSAAVFSRGLFVCLLYELYLRTFPSSQGRCEFLGALP